MNIHNSWKEAIQNYFFVIKIIWLFKSLWNQYAVGVFCCEEDIGGNIVLSFRKPSFQFRNHGIYSHKGNWEKSNIHWTLKAATQMIPFLILFYGAQYICH